MKDLGTHKPQYVFTSAWPLEVTLIFLRSEELVLRGMVASHEVVVMIDSGATHNFISLTLVHDLGLPVDTSKLFGVTLGHGKTIGGMGSRDGVSLDLGSIVLTEISLFWS